MPVVGGTLGARGGRAKTHLARHRERGSLEAGRSPASLEANDCTPDPASLWTRAGPRPLPRES